MYVVDGLPDITWLALGETLSVNWIRDNHDSSSS